MSVNHKILRGLRLVAATSAIACAASVAFAAPSFAGNYSVKSCDASTSDPTSLGESWDVSNFGSSIHPVNECPAGLVFDTQQVVEQGQRNVIWFRPGSDSILNSVAFDFYGGDTSGGFRYTLRSCEYLCGELAELVPGASKAAPSHAQVSIPNSEQSSIAIQAECEQAFCADPPEFVVRNFEFEYTDDVPATVSNVQTVPANILDPEANIWLNGESFQLSFDAFDGGSGVSQAGAALDLTSYVDLLPNACLRPYGAALCEAYATASTTISIAGLQDGTHDLVLGALDAIPPTSEPVGEHFDVKVDHTPPAEPAEITLTGGVTKWGWTSSPEITIAHADATLEARNTEFSGFKHATFDLRAGVNGESVVSKTETDPSAPSTITIPHEGKWDAGVSYSDNAGNVGNRGHLSVGFDSDTPEPADPIPHEWVSLEALHAGIDQTWTAPPANSELESGICGYAFSVDDDPLGIPAPTATVLAPKTSASIPSGIGEGRHFAHVRAIACNGLPSSTETAPVRVDGTAPTPTLHGLPPGYTGGWLATQPQLSLSAIDALSGVAGLEYGFDGAAMTFVPGSATAITVPAGSHSLAYRAIDLAGNKSQTVERQLSADWSAPNAEFLATDPVRPNVLAATVMDAESGLAAAGMEIRRIDPGARPLDASWQSLGEPSALSRVGGKEDTLVRSIPDGELPDGLYEVRVTARDVAGNWGESVPARQIQLPLRAKPALSAAIAKIAKGHKVKWSGATADRVIRYGERAALVGTLLDGAGTPVVGARIGLTTTPEFGTAMRLDDVTTDARGEFVLRVPRGPTRRYALRFDGNAQLQPISGTATVRVRAALKLRVTPRRVRSGRPFTLRGSLRSGSIGLPEGGKLVTIEFLRKRKWVPSIATPRVDSRGRFKVRWAPGVVASKSTKVYFRARAQRDGTWPFLTGSSKPVVVRVLPTR